MKLLQRNARLLLGLGFFALAGCVVNLAFDMNQDFVVDAVGNNLSQVVAFDLSQYQEVQQHKTEVKSLGIDSVDVTVSTVNAGNKATTLTGKLALRAAGANKDGSQDVLVGQVTGLQIAQGKSFHLPGNPQVDAFLFAQLQGAGQFSAVISGTTDGEAHLALNAKLHANMGYGN